MSTITKIFLICISSLFIYPVFAIDEGKKVPLEYIKKYYPIKDKLSSSFPVWFLSDQERIKIENIRLSIFRKNYNLDDLPTPEKNKKKKPIITPADVKLKKIKKVKSKLYIYGYYFDEVTKQPIVNVNGRFVKLEKLLKTRRIHVIKSVPGLLVVQANKKTYRIEVGKPLSL